MMKIQTHGNTLTLTLVHVDSKPTQGVQIKELPAFSPYK
jgi:hypothetical protein